MHRTLPGFLAPLALVALAGGCTYVQGSRDGAPCDSDEACRNGQVCDPGLNICVDPGAASDDGTGDTNTTGDTTSTGTDPMTDDGTRDICGDGMVTGDEECDDGNNDTEACDYGLTACTVCNAQCQEVSGEVAYCGDDVQNGPESCDDGAENTDTGTCDYGLTECTVCNTSCELDSGAVQYCGDGSLNGPEFCDSGGVNTDMCDSDCTAPQCGDGLLNTAIGEQCDDLGPILGAETCGDYGFVGGDLTCQMCNLGFDSCNNCGNAQLDIGEFCDTGMAACDTCSVTGSNLRAYTLVAPPEVDLATEMRVASAGDVDNDGLGDVLVAFPYYGFAPFDDWKGITYLFLGADMVAEPVGTTFNLSTAAYKFVGLQLNYSGQSISSAGDVDGDGRSDILIGAPYGNAGTTAGQTYLMLGADIVALPPGTTVELATDASYSFVGEAPEDWSGASVAGAGDVNFDGFDDVLIGARGNDSSGTDAGKTYLMLGSAIQAAPTGTSFDLSNAHYAFLGQASGVQSGGSVAGAGDVDGDELADILIGSPNSANPAGVSLVRASEIVSQPVGTVFNLSSADSFGPPELACCNATSAGDIDNDGNADILLRGETGAYVMRGFQIEAEPPGTEFDLESAAISIILQGGAASLASAGDVNGDGRADVLFGGDDDARFMAGATIDALSPGTSIALQPPNATVFTVDALTYDLESVSSAGDVNGDGRDDLLIGVGEGSGGDEGRAYVILSPY